MYKYKYVSVNFNSGFAKNSLEDHRDIIDNLAKDGWRFVSAIPTLNKGYGMISELDLVFEKPIENE